MIFAAVVRRLIHESILGTVILGCVFAWPAPTLAQVRKNAPIMLADEVMLQTGLGDCLPAGLSAETLRLARANADDGPARALQGAMRRVRRGEGIERWQQNWAHPAAWAPFTVISNGDEAVVTGRLEQGFSD